MVCCMSLYRWLCSLILCAVLSGCMPTPPPQNIHQACAIFSQYNTWYWAALKSQQRWGTPVSVQLAFLKQESHFHQYAKPPRGKLLGFIPWKRSTSSSGYAQATRGTWAHYEKAIAKSQNRHSFADNVNFIGWYTYTIHKKLRIPQSNAYALYLAYHEGMGGYKRRSYLKKPWLLDVANRVSRNATLYHRQLIRCAHSLPKKHWWSIF